MNIHNDERLCCNCQHFDSLPFRVPSWLQDYGVCRIKAVEPDAGEALVILTGQGHCLNHQDAFEASEEYLEELRKYGHVLKDRLRAARMWGVPCNP